MKEVEDRHSFHRTHTRGNLSGIKDILEKAKEKTKQTFHRSRETIACTCCYDDFFHKDLVRLDCQHSYCKPCFHRLVLNALKTEDRWPPRCCVSPIDHKTCLKNISKPVAAIYKEKRQEYSTPFADRYYCPALDCGLYVPPHRINAPYRRAKCKNKHQSCMDCRRPAHLDAVNCDKNQDMDLVQIMALHEGWRRCHRCRTMIEHKTACRHIKCRCGAEFCYVCGAKWWTCGCTERQLKDIKERVRRGAEERRTQEVRDSILGAEDPQDMSKAQQILLDEEIARRLESLP